MTPEPIFQCKWFFTTMSVFPDRVTKKAPLGFGNFSIPAKQIATVRITPILGQALIETNGGAVHKFVIGTARNLTAFEEAINGIIGN